MTMIDKPKLCKAVEDFEARQHSLSDLGAADSEPNGMFAHLMAKAVKGEPWVEPKPEAWQLYSSLPGWRRAAQRLTSAAHKVYTKIQKASLLDAQAVSKWYGWGT